MKIPFDRIKTQLQDPFFEVRHLGKKAVRQRTSPVNTYGGSPENLHFTDWTAADDRETIYYSFPDSAIGRLLVGSTSKGICFLGFAGDGEDPVRDDFMWRFPHQPFEERTGAFQQAAVAYCNGDHMTELSLHLKGTAFQSAIWKQLVRIPEGRLSTYGSLAPKAGGARAVGSAVGANPVSYIVPCHRIVKSDGSFEGYYWGTEIKRQLLAYELQL